MALGTNYKRNPRDTGRAGCQIGMVTQGACNRKAATIRDTGKTEIHLCAKCDKLFGDRIGTKKG